MAATAEICFPTSRAYYKLNYYLFLLQRVSMDFLSLFLPSMFYPHIHFTSVYCPFDQYVVFTMHYVNG